MDSSLRWRLQQQVVQKCVDVSSWAFEKDFHARVAAVLHVTCQSVLKGGAVDERAETHALDNASYVDFELQRLTLLRLE